MNGRYGKKELCEKDRGSMEDTRKFPAGVVLCGLKYSKEGRLTDVSEPDLGSVCKDRDEDSVKDAAPRDKLQASDGISEDAESLNEAADTVGHGLDVKCPVEFGREEDTQITNGLGNGDLVGRVGPGGKEDGGRGNAKEVGVRA